MGQAQQKVGAGRSHQAAFMSSVEFRVFQPGQHLNGGEVTFQTVQGRRHLRHRTLLYKGPARLGWSGVWRAIRVHTSDSCPRSSNPPGPSCARSTCRSGRLAPGPFSNNAAPFWATCKASYGLRKTDRLAASRCPQRLSLKGRDVQLAASRTGRSVRAGLSGCCRR